jgi:hypothetical protein
MFGKDDYHIYTKFGYIFFKDVTLFIMNFDM